MKKRIYAMVTFLVVIIIAIGSVAVYTDSYTTTDSGITTSTVTIPTSSSFTTTETTKLDIGNFVPTPDNNIPLTDSEYYTADKSYFDDALFIGDSRTVGLQMYSDIDNADFFCSVGLNAFKIFSQTVEIGGASTDLKTLLMSKQYGKIYIMLGINELGYNRTAAFNKYKELISEIEKHQIGCKIFVQANIHVGAERSAKDSVINNNGINEFNTMLSTLENRQNIFYIDVNSQYDDASGNLSTEYSSDGIHLYPKHFSLWRDYLLTKAV